MIATRGKATALAAMVIALAVLGLAGWAVMLVLAMMVLCSGVILAAELARPRGRCLRDHEIGRPWGQSTLCSCPDKRD